MEIRVFETAREASVAAAQVITDVINTKKKTVLGLATGSTPVGMYQDLARRNRAGEVDFSNVYSYNLDEYIGLDGTHPQSYRYFMNKNLFDHINIDKAHTHVPCGSGADHEADAHAYDEAIKAEGGIDVQVLGIGNNGHIGFNEPDTVFRMGTHVVDLTASTIDANKRFFLKREDVPTQAITLGMGGIMGAKKIVMLCFGEGKAKAVRDMICGEIDPGCQASILKVHSDVIVFLDRAAASLL